MESSALDRGLVSAAEGHSPLPRPVALFAATILGLAGGNACQVDSLIMVFLYSDQLPATELYRSVFWIWALLAIFAVLCGFRGGFRLISRGDLQSSALATFLGMSCVTIKPSNSELGFSFVRLAIDIGVKDFRIGLNLLGVLAVWWWFALRRRYDPPPSFAAGSEAADP